ncbi:ABC transporter ATP-binding protein [Aquibacillus albus]|uniref:Multiple sugar transport system ATP-binding protein n=1 Tax=Aquibacillus albus TaxID=1168171 RepID=A0ABS2MWA1_9BACI|nr:sn-glycerol-3-phosphate ABC transporter ATP-binding protein UgpC [Aquibacillus albus]MBM7570172.1 multiple sugar transport system ATP-binding protein [Aquibacillus albus]
MSTIKLANIVKQYDKNTTAVTDFNLDIDDKEFIVFVGPSGCGKSTTLRMIAGLEEITSGDFFIDNQRMNDVAPKDRDIAMVFQNYALYPHMNVYDNMAFGLKLRKVKQDEIDLKVKDAARILGLEAYLTRKPKALSGGQRQRVALGRAIVRDAKVFLMDEPLSNLDAKLRVQMRTEIQKLHRRLQTTTIYVTHDQTEAMTMATRLIVMKDGEIQQIGVPKDVYDKPNNVFVGGFIGSPSMNFINGKISNGYFHIDDEHKLKLPEDCVTKLVDQGYDNQELILGIRPEDLDDSSAADNSETVLNVYIEVAELMGAETFIYSKIAGKDLIARVDAQDNLTDGDTKSLTFDMDKAHFFDVATELRID